MKTKKLLITSILVIGTTLFYTSCSKDKETVVPPTPPISDVSTPGAGVTFDGYTYASIILGNGQEWMAENLRTTKFCNGDSIPNGSWVYYNNDSQYENPYGKLYTWYAVNDNRNICPCGWRVPNDADWRLGFFSSGDLNQNGGKMKSTGTQYWQSPNTNATNETGFSGLPGGYRNNGGFFGDIGLMGWWWSSSDAGANNTWTIALSNTSSAVGRHSQPKGFGVSVRCIKN